MRKGVVRLNFGMLRKSALPDVYNFRGAKDNTLIDIRSGEFSPALTADELSRQTTYARIEVRPM